MRCGNRLSIVVRAFGRACDDGFAGDGFMKISRSACHLSATIRVGCFRRCPSVVDLSLHKEFQSQIAVLDTLAAVRPRTKETCVLAEAVPSRSAHEAAPDKGSGLSDTSAGAKGAREVGASSKIPHHGVLALPCARK